MTFQRALSPEKEQALVVEYEDGWTVHELTIIYRVSERTVYRILARHGAPLAHKNKGRQRKRKAPLSKPRELKPCGTEAAYRRHKRHGEYPCGLCLAAHVEDVSNYKKGKK